MDSIHGFSDGLFCNENEAEGKTTKTTIPFQPNVMNSMWFLDQNHQGSDDCQTLKYIGDYLFLNKQYKEALSTYEDCLKHTPCANQTLTRDVTESCIWCHIKLNDMKQAHLTLKKFKENLLSSFRMPEQHTPAYYVELIFNKEFCQTNEQINAINNLLKVHDQDASLWLELGILYMDQIIDKFDIQSCSQLEQLTIHQSCENVSHSKIKEMALSSFCQAEKLASYHHSICTSFYKDSYDKMRNLSLHYKNILTSK